MIMAQEGQANSCASFLRQQGEGVHFISHTWWRDFSPS